MSKLIDIVFLSNLYGHGPRSRFFFFLKHIGRKPNYNNIFYIIIIVEHGSLSHGRMFEFYNY